MVEKFLKFIEKSPIKDTLLIILRDIYEGKLDNYDIKPMQGYKDMYRIRKGNVRIIFKKTKNGNMIIKIDKRGDVYKGII